MTSAVKVLVLVFACLAVANGLPFSYDYGTSGEAYDIDGVPLAACANVGELSCSANCTGVDLCTASGTLQIEKCSSSQRCDSITHTCSAASDASCLLKPDESYFKCHSNGSFPHPFDCQKHHYCIQTDTWIDLVYTCEEGTAYDPLTTLCVLSPEHRVCVEKPVPACRRAEQNGPQQENPNIYYICVREGDYLVPWLFRCDHDLEVYDGTACVMPDGNQTTTPTTTPISTHETTTSWWTTTDTTAWPTGTSDTTSPTTTNTPTSTPITTTNTIQTTTNTTPTPTTTPTTTPSTTPTSTPTTPPTTSLTTFPTTTIDSTQTSTFNPTGSTPVFTTTIDPVTTKAMNPTG